MTPEEMRKVVPAAVITVCQTLRDSGYEAWIVGGAVRDLVLGKTPDDWDVASDALPEAVLGVFEKTIATGLAHGTVTAIVGRGREREQVEITSFRGEGAYSDSRRPDSVHFGVPLDEDLLRRDFVVNAMAYDPINRVIHDPLGGVSDLQNKILRAVGVAAERFDEDGLRVMRAVRFVSTLGFSLDADTEQAISSALEALSKVAQERVRVELWKLLSGKAPSEALDIAMQQGVVNVVLPELMHIDFESALMQLSQLPRDPIVRLAALVAEVEVSAVDTLLRRIKTSNEDRQRIVAMLRYQGEFSKASSSDFELRKHLSRVGRKPAEEHLLILESKACYASDESTLKTIAKARDILGSGCALGISELALKGGRLMEVTGLKGRAVGDTLAAILNHVLETPSDNEAAVLEELAQQLASEE